MYSIEQQDLWEAYKSIYEPQELTEEVEIAAQYFYEMGLNEEGVTILIEELGVGEFADWVYDIAEDYYLTERKLEAGETTLPARSRRKIGGEKAGSRKFSDPEKKSTAGGKRRAARAAARDEGGEEETPRQARIRELRSKAANNAAKKQPKKRGFLDRVAHEVNKGIKRHQEAMSAARETGKVVGKAAKGVGEVAKGVASGLSGTARLAGHIASKGLGEETDLFDIILEYLVAEGYADTNKAALAIMANMSEEWKQSIVEAYGSFGANMAGAELQRRLEQKVRTDERKKIEQEKNGGSGASSQVKGA